MKWIPLEDQIRKKLLPNTMSQQSVHTNDYIESTPIHINVDNHRFS